MAKIENLTIGVSVEAILQKEIVAVVEEVNRNHGLTIDSIDFTWAFGFDGEPSVVRCETCSSYNVGD